MAYLKRPQAGERVLQSLYDSVISIIDYLPTLEVRGDNYSTSVEHSAGGTVIHAKRNVSPDQGGGGREYYAGSGLTLSGNVFYNALSGDGTTIQIVDNVISCLVRPSGGGPSGPDNDTTYTGEYNVYSSGWISVNSSGSNPHLISSNLRNIEQLYNYPLVANSNIVMPDSLTACNNTVDISQVGSIYSNHYIQTRDIFHDGAGTRINFAWMKNPFGDTSEGGTNGIVQGLQVDLTLSGGRFADVVLHKHVFGAYDPNTGTRYDPPDESRVDCLLTGTYNHFPHTTGFIDIVPVEMEDGKTWGVISTNLHAGSGIAIDAKTGEITCTIEGGGGGPGGGIEYYDGRFISISSDNTINCTLSSLSELYNPPLVSKSRPLCSQVDNVQYYYNHFMQLGDWVGNKGQNTIVTKGSFIKTPQGAGEPGSWQYIYQYTGPQVDCVLTGGRFIDVHSHWQNSGGETPEQIEPDDHTINSLLSGDNSHIFIKELTGYDQINDDGSWGGIISTNIHGDEVTIHMAEDGTLSCMGGGGGNVPTPVANTVLSATSNGTMQWTANTGGSGGGGGGIPWPMWENLCGSGNIVLTQTWYTTSTGGWLRISNKSGTGVGGCNSIYIDPTVPPIVDGVRAIGKNHIGLGVGVMTYPLAIPPGSSFYIEFPSGDTTRCWFDGSTSPAKTNSVMIEGSKLITKSSEVAVEQAGIAQSNCNTAYSNAIGSMKYDYQEYIGDDNIEPPDDYKDWYYNTYNAYNAAAAAATLAQQAAISCQNAYTVFVDGGGTISQSYVDAAIAASGQAEADATSAHNMVLTAGYYYDLAYNHYLTCPNHSGWFAEYEQDYGQPFQKYDD